MPNTVPDSGGDADPAEAAPATPRPKTSLRLRASLEPARLSAPVDAPGTGAKREAPLLQIGAIEVRIAQPASPVPTAPVAPAARPASAPIARSYASRFGLAQG